MKIPIVSPPSIGDWSNVDWSLTSPYGEKLKESLEESIYGAYGIPSSVLEDMQTCVSWMGNPNQREALTVDSFNFDCAHPNFVKMAKEYTKQTPLIVLSTLMAKDPEPYPMLFRLHFEAMMTRIIGRVENFAEPTRIEVVYYIGDIIGHEVEFQGNASKFVAEGARGNLILDILGQTPKYEREEVELIHEVTRILHNSPWLQYRQRIRDYVENPVARMPVAPDGPWASGKKYAQLRRTLSRTGK